MKAAVLGAGSWGTTFAQVLCDAGTRTVLYSRKPALAKALELLLAGDVDDEAVGRGLSLSSTRNGNIVTLEMWDDEALHLLAARQVQAARDAGALVHLQFALSFLARSQMLAGDLTAAGLTLDEARLMAEATGNPAANGGGLRKVVTGLPAGSLRLRGSRRRRR